MAIPPRKKCIFCEIVKGKSPAHRIYEDGLSLGILDTHPFTQGHCLVIPRRHVPWWHELTAEETSSLFEVSRMIARKMMKIFRPDFVCMYARGRRIRIPIFFWSPPTAGTFWTVFSMPWK